jgi:hypothetical protein
MPESLWHLTKPLRLAGTILIQDSHRVNMVEEMGQSNQMRLLLILKIITA